MDIPTSRRRWQQAPDEALLPWTMPGLNDWGISKKKKKMKPSWKKYVFIIMCLSSLMGYSLSAGS
jgi:hypothetical protein